MITLIARDPVSYESDTRFIITNSIIHELDTISWIFYPFDDINIEYVNINHSDINIKLFIMVSSKPIIINIEYSKEHTSYLNKVIVEHEEKKQIFEVDWKEICMTDRYKGAYISSWNDFIERFVHKLYI